MTVKLVCSNMLLCIVLYAAIDQSHQPSHYELQLDSIAPVQTGQRSLRLKLGASLHSNSTNVISYGVINHPIVIVRGCSRILQK
jgi:hypothetical protein